MTTRIAKLEWVDHDEGGLTIRCSSPEDFNEFLAGLSQEEPHTVFDGGEAVYVRSTGPVTEPAADELPRDVTFPVQREERPSNSPRWLMKLANNFLQKDMLVRVVDLSWNESVDPRQCRFAVDVYSHAEYLEIQLLVDHPRGSALLPFWEDAWYVRRLVDDAPAPASFPQVVEMTLEEVPKTKAHDMPSSPPYAPEDVRGWLIPIVQRWDLEQDLAAFAATFEPDTRLVYRDTMPYLTSDRLVAAWTIDEALELATAMVTVLNAAASLASVADGNYRPIELGPQAIVVLADGRELEHPAPPEGFRVTVVPGEPENPWALERRGAIQRAAVKHGGTPTVAQVLRLWMSRPHTWASLYVILELVERHAGATVSQLGWTSNNVRDLFRHTANALPVDENLPRHGASKQPPAKPLPFPAAISFIRNTIGEWLLWIDGQATQPPPA